MKLEELHGSGFCLPVGVEGAYGLEQGGEGEETAAWGEERCHHCVTLWRVGVLIVRMGKDVRLLEGFCRPALVSLVYFRG